LFDRKLILSAAPVGLVLGAAIWLVIGRGGPRAEALEQVQTELSRMRPANARPSARSGQLALATAPMFGPAPGEIIAPEATVSLQGVVRTPRRQAALVAINGKAPEWLGVGETRDGVTLESLSTSSITVVMANGAREIGFGPAGATPPSSGPDPSSNFKSPPPPASAPGTP
jgi:hypothetical protein